MRTLVMRGADPSRSDAVDDGRTEGHYRLRSTLHLYTLGFQVFSSTFLGLDESSSSSSSISSSTFSTPLSFRDAPLAISSRCIWSSRSAYRSCLSRTRRADNSFSSRVRCSCVSTRRKEPTGPGSFVRDSKGSSMEQRMDRDQPSQTPPAHERRPRPHRPPRSPLLWLPGETSVSGASALLGTSSQGRC